MRPLFSIVVPCYNQAEFLDEALQSVLNQSFANWECLVVNDGSPDYTKKIAAVWTKKDSRFKYLEKSNGGLVSARNHGIENAIGEFILPLDADDKIASNYLANALQAFESNGNLKIVYGKAIKFGLLNEEWNLKPFSMANLAKYNMIFCSAIYRKKDWFLANGYDINMTFGLEDWEFWISILKHGGEVCKLNEIVFYYRIKENSMLESLTLSKEKKLLEYMSRKHIDFYIQNLGSFVALHRQIEIEKSSFKSFKKSKKNSVNLFFQTFFGITIFKKV